MLWMLRMVWWFLLGKLIYWGFGFSNMWGSSYIVAIRSEIARFLSVPRSRALLRFLSGLFVENVINLILVLIPCSKRVLWCCGCWVWVGGVKRCHLFLGILLGKEIFWGFILVFKSVWGLIVLQLFLVLGFWLGFLSDLLADNVIYLILVLISCLCWLSDTVDSWNSLIAVKTAILFGHFIGEGDFVVFLGLWADEVKLYHPEPFGNHALCWSVPHPRILITLSGDYFDGECDKFNPGFDFVLKRVFDLWIIGMVSWCSKKACFLGSFLGNLIYGFY